MPSHSFLHAPASESVSIDTYNNTSCLVCWRSLCRGHVKTKRRGAVALNEFLDRHWPLRLYLDLWRLPLSRRGLGILGAGAQYLRSDIWLYIVVTLLPTITHCVHGTTPAPTFSLWLVLPICPGGWMALIGKICGPVIGLTIDWQ